MARTYTIAIETEVEGTQEVNQLNKALEGTVNAADDAQEALDSLDDTKIDVNADEAAKDIKKFGDASRKAGKDTKAGFDEINKSAIAATTGLTALTNKSADALQTTSAAGTSAQQALTGVKGATDVAGTGIKNVGEEATKTSTTMDSLAQRVDDLSDSFESGEINVAQFATGLSSTLQQGQKLNEQMRQERELRRNLNEDLDQSSRRLEDNSKSVGRTRRAIGAMNRTLIKSKEFLLGAFGGAAFAIVNRFVDAIVNNPFVQGKVEEAFKKMNIATNILTTNLGAATKNADGFFNKIAAVARELNAIDAALAKLELRAIVSNEEISDLEYAKGIQEDILADETKSDEERLAASIAILDLQTKIFQVQKDITLERLKQQPSVRFEEFEYQNLFELEQTLIRQYEKRRKLQEDLAKLEALPNFNAARIKAINDELITLNDEIAKQEFRVATAQKPVKDLELALYDLDNQMQLFIATFKLFQGEAGISIEQLIILGTKIGIITAQMAMMMSLPVYPSGTGEREGFIPPEWFSDLEEFIALNNSAVFDIGSAWGSLYLNLDRWARESSLNRQQQAEDATQGIIMAIDQTVNFASQMYNILADQAEGNSKEAQESRKKHALTNIVLDTIMGTLGAFVQAIVSYPPPASYVIGGVSAAAVNALGIAAYQKALTADYSSSPSGAGSAGGLAVTPTSSIIGVPDDEGLKSGSAGQIPIGGDAGSTDGTLKATVVGSDVTTTQAADRYATSNAVF